jgi:hypothetical protein
VQKDAVAAVAGDARHGKMSVMSRPQPFGRDFMGRPRDTEIDGRECNIQIAISSLPQWLSSGSCALSFDTISKIIGRPRPEFL